MKKKFLLIAFLGMLVAGVSGQHPTIGGYNVYYGDLHNHSNVSDGSGTPAAAYNYAKNTAHLDFFGLSDHFFSISATEWTDIKNQAISYNKDGVFTTFYGFEWSADGIYGNITVLGTDDYCASGSPTNTFTGLVTWLASRPNGIAFFDHPGVENQNGLEFNHFTTTPSSQFVGMELFNKGDGFNVYYYNDGYFTGDNNKSYIDEANSRGWKVGASGSGDNHIGTWGNSYPYRLAILSNSLTRADLLSAMKARRFFSTLDKNLSLSFKINGLEMGSTVTGGNWTAQIQASDADGEIFREVILYDKNHNIVNTWSLNTSTLNVSRNINAVDGDYYYVKVKQADGDEAISSPIWISGGYLNQYPACSITSPTNGAIFTAPINITIQAGATDADGSIYKVEFYQGTTKLGEDLTSPYSFPWNNVSAGSYNLTVKAIDNSGAATTSSAVFLTINTRPITVTAYPGTKVFGEADPELTFRISSGTLAGTDIFSGALTRVAGENAGTYPVSQGTLALNNNYTLTYEEADFAITERPITIRAEPKTKVYGESDPELTYMITSGTLAGTDIFSGALTRVAGENAGTYPVRQGTLALNNNYTLTYEEADFAITERPITIRAEPKTRVYGESDPELTYMITSGTLAGTDIFSGALTRVAGENAGTYPVRQGTLALNSNYILTYKESDFAVTERPITIRAEPKTKVYGESDPELTYMITSGTLAGTDIFSGALTRVAGENAGTYPVRQGTLALNSNYILTYKESDFAVTERPITIRAEPKTKVYGESDPELTYMITSGNLAGTDIFSGALTRVAGENTGTYTIRQGTLALNSNYTLTCVEADFFISSRPITIKADPKTKVYGESDPELMWQITSGTLVRTDIFRGFLTRDAGENIGIYSIRQGTLILNRNYALIYKEADFTITPRPITVRADSKTKLYGEYDPLLTFQIISGNLVGTDAFRGSVIRDAGEKIGIYYIRQGTLALNSNYLFEYVNSSFAISSSFKMKVFPNPFSDHIYFELELKKDANFSIEIFNLNGIKIAKVFSGDVEADVYHFEYIPEHISSGFLIYQLTIEGQVMERGKAIHK